MFMKLIYINGLLPTSQIINSSFCYNECLVCANDPDDGSESRIFDLLLFNCLVFDGDTTNYVISLLSYVPKRFFLYRNNMLLAFLHVLIFY